ncbi:MAG: hypothetical protein V7680_03885 [Parasphingorhabdus sp.]
MHDLANFGKNLDKGKIFWFRQFIAGVGLRKVQQLIDQMKQMAAGRYARRNHLMLFLRHLHVKEVRAIANDCVQRRAQFMANAREEQAFGLARFLGFFLGLGDFGNQRRAIGWYYQQSYKKADRERGAVTPEVDGIDGKPKGDSGHSRSQKEPGHPEAKAISENDPQHQRIKGSDACSADLEYEGCCTKIGTKANEPSHIRRFSINVIGDRDSDADDEIDAEADD